MIRSSTSEPSRLAPLNLVGPQIGPVHLAAVDVQGQASGGDQSGGDQVFDLRAVEVGTLDLVRAVVGPVHLAAGLVQSQAIGIDQARGDQVLDVGAVQVGTLDLVRGEIRPVDLARSNRRGGYWLAYAGRQPRIGRVVEVGGDDPGVGQIDPAVPVDVPQGDVAVVGHGDEGVPAVQGHQQGIEEVDPAVVVHVSQYPRASRGGGLRER